MKDLIVKALRAENIENYTITGVKATCAEMFFVKQTIDMTRTEETNEWNVTVYHDDEREGSRLRGSAASIIHQGMNEEEVREKIRDAYRAAGYAMNPYFELVKGKKEEKKYQKGVLASMHIADAAGKMAQALFAEDKGRECFVNSAELFVKKKEVSIYNSCGVDCSYVEYTVSGEFVVQCIHPEDVELYQDFSYDELAEDELRKLVKERLDVVADRAKAVNAPTAGNYDVLLSEDSVREVLSFYVQRSNAGYIFPKYSSYEVGTKVQGENAEGEKLNISLHSSAPYNADGIVMKDCELISDGELKKIHGGLRLCRYLNVEPTGEYSKIIVKNGSRPLESMKKSGRVLHVVSFSDFYMNAMSGHFAGEIRLAYLYENGEVSLVTGGSVNGSLIEAQDKLIFSKERYDNSHYSGPYAILLKNVPVSGK